MRNHRHRAGLGKDRLRFASAFLLRRRTISLVVSAALLIAPFPSSGWTEEAAPAAADATSSTASETYSAEQLDALLAPIALYPDPLLTQVLMASAYPLEVVAAARWVEEPANKGLTGTALENALATQSWDPSVKSLVPFPQVLLMMNNQLDWMQQLGYAMSVQESDVMDSVQRLRLQAKQAGQLQSTEQQVVSTEGQAIIIQPAQPNVVYVPVYNPTVVYGTWAYPAYPPVYLPPPPAYYAGPAIVAGLYFGAAVAVTAGLWGWATPRWGYGGYGRSTVNINVKNYNTINVNRPPINNPNWRPPPPNNRPGGGNRPPPGPVGRPGQPGKPGYGPGPGPGPGKPGGPGPGPGKPGGPGPGPGKPGGGKPPPGKPPGGNNGPGGKPPSTGGTPPGSRPGGGTGGKPPSSGGKPPSTGGKPPVTGGKPPGQSGKPSGGQNPKPPGGPGGRPGGAPSGKPGGQTPGQGSRPSGGPGMSKPSGGQRPPSGGGQRPASGGGQRPASGGGQRPGPGKGPLGN